MTDFEIEGDRFIVNLNEDNEVESILDKRTNRERDFAEFIGFINQFAEEHNNVVEELHEVQFDYNMRILECQQLKREKEELVNSLSDEIFRNTDLSSEINKLRIELMRAKEINTLTE